MNATALRSGPLPAFAGYLFDLDGTLVDTAPDINAALNLALQGAGFTPVAESLTRHWVGHGAKVLVEEALSHLRAPPALVDELRDAFINHYERAIAEHSQPYPAVIETLTTLRDRGSRLAVVTNKMTRLALPLLEELDMLRWFDCIVCGDTAARPKPAADPALHALWSGQDAGPPRCVGEGSSLRDRWRLEHRRATNVPRTAARGGNHHGHSPLHGEPRASRPRGRGIDRSGGQAGAHQR